MSRKPILIAILAAALAASCPLAARTTEPAARPALPALPDLDRWARTLDDLKPPPAAPGTVAIRKAQDAEILSGSFSEAAETMPDWRGLAVVVERGVYTLDALAVAAGRPDLLRCRPDGCELNAPLVVSPGAGLVIAGSRQQPLRLRAVQEAGAFVVNAGILHLEHAAIVGWSAAAQAPAETDGRRFRPFVAGFGGGDTVVLHSTLRHLGFDGAKAYGFSLSALPHLFPRRQPSARILSSRFEDLYYGLYTYGARSVVVMSSLFSESHRYGIDPHDASSRLLIARNEVHGAGDHGVILSDRVSDSWVVDNVVRDNARSGLVIDAGSTGNIVAGNRLEGNRRDGIAIFESHENVIAANMISGNGGVGIRIRAGAANLVADNAIRGSGEYGIEAYDWPDTEKSREPEQQKDRRPVSLTLFGNSFAGNLVGACQFKSVRVVTAYADTGSGLEPCDQPGAETGDEVWRPLPGEPGAARLEPADGPAPVAGSSDP